MSSDITYRSSAMHYHNQTEHYINTIGLFITNTITRKHLLNNKLTIRI